MKPRSLNHEYTHKVLEGLNEAYWEWDLELDTVFYSAKLMLLLGYKAKAFKDSREFWFKHFSKTHLDEIYHQFDLHLKGKIKNVDVSYPLKSNNDETIWVHSIAKIIEYNGDRASLIFGTVKNITDSKKIYSQLKKQNDWLSLTERASKSAHWRYDIHDKTFIWSSEVYRVLGLAEQSFEPTLESIGNLFNDKDRPLFKDKLTNSFNELQPFYFKGTIKKDNAIKVKVEIISEIARDVNGIPQGVFGVIKDISQQENIFEKLKLLAMVNLTIKVPIFFIDDNDNVVYQDISPHHDNESSVLFNYINFSITEYMSYKKKAMEQGQVKDNNVSFDRYNSVFDLSVTYEPEEGIYIWIVENVTDKFRQQQQQIISNRLALLGNTFGNVSHDINNVLGVALGAIEMLEIKFARGDQNISTYIERVKNAIDKGKSVTERLLAFTRKPTIKVVNFDPIQDIKDNKYLFKQLLLSTINISFKFEPIHCTINFPQGEFINILLNLVLNAQDAIQEKGLSGKIEVSVNLAQANRLEIHVKDSGIGIAKDNLNKIFDPFYSSKSVNKGNGIGLANVYNTMYKHNGKIQVEGTSEIGGAHFTLVFKCTELQKRFQAVEISEDNSRLKGKKVLVLDDEISIAEFVALFVETNGADVMIANNKEELMNILIEDNNFDIFITDMILPDLSGKEAVNMVTEKFPNIKVYSISGYIAIEDRSWLYPVLRKPFNSKELAAFLAK
ncbi:MAG: PAS domain-containing protein [Colwellia sp.]|nr:PAS domain-containing protein [Colwellia sp.]